MSRARLAALSTLTVLIAAPACSGDAPSVSSEQKPFQDDWKTEVETDFPYNIVDDAGDPAIGITSITVGGALFNDNFENRGDVLVSFDGDDNKIKVEMRRFTWREDEEEADDDFAKVQLWAYSTNVTSPKAPGEMDEARNCNSVDPDSGDPFPWQDGCGIRLYYEGQIQPTRLGADLRVTLPSNYRHTLNVVTGDNDAEEDYLNRGDVCIENLNGTGDVKLESGLAYVLLDEATTPGPTCSDADIEACETWTVDGMDAAWDPQCPCQAFGRLKVETQGSGSSNITIDAPSNLWASMTLENRGEDQSAAGEHCEATIDWSTDAIETEQDSAVPWKIRGEANHPSDVAIEFAGYAIQGFSSQCAPVQHTDTPGDYVGPGNAEDQASEERGDVVVCNDCIRDQSCEDLLPGV